MSEDGGGGEEAPPSLSKGQAVLYNVGIAVNMVERVSEATNKMALALGRVKDLFKPFERQGQQTMTVVGQAAQAAAGGGGGGSGGGMGGIAAIAMQFNAITQAASTIYNAVTPMMALSSAAETTRNNLAGTFVALGHAGDINQGLDLARETLADIRRESAALPGEASEYLAVFQAGLPNLSSALNNNMEHMRAFSNRFAAIGRSMGIDAQQIGNDLARMTQQGRGGAGMDVRTFTSMLPFINSYRQNMHQAALTTETFNAMTQANRVQLLENSFQALSPMIDRASGSWDAMTGAISSNVSRIKMDAFEPLFEQIKKSTKVFSDWLDASADGFISIGRNISTYLAGGLENAMGSWNSFQRSFINLSSRMTPMLAGLGSVGREINARSGGAAAVGTGAAAAMTGPLGAILGGGLGEFMKNIEAVNSTVLYAVEGFNMLGSLLLPIVELFDFLNVQMGVILSAVIPALSYAFLQVSTGIAEFAAALAPIWTEISTALGPAIREAAGGLGNFIRAIGDFALPMLRAFAQILQQAWSDVREYVMPVIRELGGVIRDLFDWIAGFLRTVGREAQTTVNQRGGLGIRPNDLITRGLHSLAEATTENTAATTTATRTANRPTPTQRGGSRTHNDFRNSRFDITQRFAEGFDPDRVAVAFTDQLEAAATQRLDSGLNPLFSIGS